MTENNHPSISYYYRRLPTREITIGDLPVGGDNPIRIQSMVNTSPEDIKGTSGQIIALAGAGCEIVRMAIPSVRDAGRLPKLTRLVRDAGIRVPLVADVHFNPAIAELCAKYVEKVRINPGNYRTPGLPVPKIWNREAWLNEQEETEKLIKRLIKICSDHGTVVRVGSNHGSLSPRIMARYGDTPEGMVETTLEFIRIFNRNNFHDLVVSMKSSNVRIMVMAYRLLVERMNGEGFHYPIHLGVTEAGLGDEGRIKSAAGIGLLLDEGIGDTIRVSLTEDPLAEIPVAQQLLKRYTKIRVLPETLPISPKLTFTYSGFKRRDTICVRGIGGKETVVVVGREVQGKSKQPDYFAETKEGVPVKELYPAAGNRSLPMKVTPFQKMSISGGNEDYAVLLPELPDTDVADMFKGLMNIVAIIPVTLHSHPGILRRWIELMDERNIKIPVIVKIITKEESEDELIVNAAVTASGIFTDGLADGLWIDVDGYDDPSGLAFNILQATRARITATEYISCPSCGRTRFNIQEAVHSIRERTIHLEGLKIGIMGCIVNGPGEMADADYGYVGAGNGTISLYKGKEVVRRGVREDEAIDALINLIKSNGDWKEPPQQVSIP